MKKNFLFFIFLLHFGGLQSQNVQIIEQNNAEITQKKQKRFEYVDTSFNLTTAMPIGKLKGETTNQGKNTLQSLFNALWEQSNTLGANAFYLDSLTHHGDSVVVWILLYNMSDSALVKNSKMLPTNEVYVFGDLDLKAQKIRRFKFNEKKIALKPLEFVKNKNAVGESTTIAIGGITGAKLWVKGKEGRESSFYSLTPFGIGPGLTNGQGLGLSFNTGRVYPIEQNFGYFLKCVLER